jgi:HlyD family secretion protein
MKKKKIRLLLVFFVLGAVAVWGATRYESDAAGLPPLNTVTVDRGAVSQRIVAHGTLEPVEQVEVGSQISGIIQRIHVDFNSPVRRGQVIAQIDPSTYETAVSSAQAELEAATTNLELAQANWERVRELGERQLVSRSEVESARASWRQAESQVNVRRHALERAQRELEFCTIYAPTDGIVISRNVDVGQTVAASLNAPLLFLIASDLEQLQIHASVSEADIGSVQEGQPVRFSVDAYRGREFTGEVIQVRNAPTVQDNVVHYTTIIAVSNEDRLLKPGMTAEVAIITAEVADAVRVRNTALRARLPDGLRPPEPAAAENTNGRVYALRNGEVIATPVRTGLSDGLHTEILEGVDVGETLVVGLSLQDTGDNRRRSLFGGRQAQF